MNFDILNSTGSFIIQDLSKYNRAINSTSQYAIQVDKVIQYMKPIK